MYKKFTILTIVALMSIMFFAGCNNPNRQQTNNKYNYQNNEGGLINAFTGNKSTSNGLDQPESTYERTGGVLGFLFGDIWKTSGPVSSKAPRRTRRTSSSSGHNRSSSSHSNTRGSKGWK